MQTLRLVVFAGLSVLTLSGSCDKQSDAAPHEPLTTGRLVKLQTTLDSKAQNPRPRWIVDLAPLALEGWAGKSFQQANVFTLPDTVAYKVGRTITFHYQLVPYAQQTPWQTFYEMMSMAAPPVGYRAYPEITLSDVALVYKQ